MRFRFRSAALLFVLVAAPAAAQVKVTVKTLTQGGKPLKQSDAFLLTRFADPARAETKILLSVGEVLSLSQGDLLRTSATDLVVELTCPKGKSLRPFTAPFRVVINPPGKADCAYMERKDGQAVATDSPKKADREGKTLGVQEKGAHDRAEHPDHPARPPGAS